MRQQFNDSPFWVQLMGNLKEYGQEYLRNEGYPLVLGESAPQIKGKPFESLLLKTFGKNVLENANWPEKPRDGWILPKGWFTMIDDVVRTLFITKYIDGVRFRKKEGQRPLLLTDWVAVCKPFARHAHHELY